MEPKKRRPGAPKGNQYAAKTDGFDGQFLLYLNRTVRDAGKAASKRIGDGGLSAMLRRLLDAEIARIEGIKIAGTLDHAKALAILQEAGAEPPVIQPGETTAVLRFMAADGPAIAINQTGFAPEASDNEEQINGLIVLVAIGNITPEEGWKVLDAEIKRILGQ